VRCLLDSMPEVQADVVDVKYDRNRVRRMFRQALDRHRWDDESAVMFGHTTVADLRARMREPALCSLRNNP
jgi:hypothetical protein